MEREEPGSPNEGSEQDATEGIDTNHSESSSPLPSATQNQDQHESAKPATSVWKGLSEIMSIVLGRIDDGRDTKSKERPDPVLRPKGAEEVGDPSTLEANEDKVAAKPQESEVPNATFPNSGKLVRKFAVKRSLGRALSQIDNPEKEQQNKRLGEQTTQPDDRISANFEKEENLLEERNSTARELLEQEWNDDQDEDDDRIAPSSVERTIEEANDTASDAEITTADPPQSNQDRQMNQITAAVDLVIDSLTTGPWPSPPRCVDPASVSRRALDMKRAEMELDLHEQHLSMVSVSLHQFATDVIAPAMIAGGVTKDDDLRVFLGTLLILREVLTTNARAIFGASAIVSGSEPDFSHRFKKTNTNLGRREEFALFGARILATSVILAGLDGLDDEDSESLAAEFLRRAKMYDNGDEEFSDNLIRIDGSNRAYLPNGSPLPPEERIAWQVSFNYHYDMHPVVVNKRKRENTADRTRRNRRKPPQLPKPNALHISILEERA
jgi:hypothetical protein